MKQNLETLCIHGGWHPTKGQPQQLPIYQSTTFKYDTSEQMARLFDLEDEGYFYTRLANPTNDAVAAKINALEGGVGCVLTSSGQAASFYAVFNICQAGDHFVTSNNIYGGTFNLFGVTMKKLGIECTFVDPDWDDERIHAAFRPNTKCFFGETISNPGGCVFDIERFARIAHEHGVPLIVDNTFATPINCRPFEWGADIVTHSTTKYMDGHATQVGGAIIDSGNFDWETGTHRPSRPDLQPLPCREGSGHHLTSEETAPAQVHSAPLPTREGQGGGSFSCLTQPDESYHGLTYTKAFGRKAYITKIVSQLMRDLGSIPSPQNCFLLNLGLETLHLRMQRHCENAQRVAEWLEQNPKVGWINYCGLPSNKYYALAQKYLPGGSCGVIAFGLKGTREEAIRFMDRLQFVSIATHVADARTCVLHPASHTHRQLSDEQLRQAGIAPDLVRLSVGIENVQDIIADLEQAMA
ncbi:MAG: aminotransferase class V-fold PLP-dependent enzyme [Bacteroidaceae bacterium]|nr:aminotransferase class V-fold PLP-dependent enzyme [Bacteroidaceae bacterium]